MLVWNIHATVYSDRSIWSTTTWPEGLARLFLVYKRFYWFRAREKLYACMWCALIIALPLLVSISICLFLQFVCLQVCIVLCDFYSAALRRSNTASRHDEASCPQISSSILPPPHALHSTFFPPTQTRTYIQMSTISFSTQYNLYKQGLSPTYRNDDRTRDAPLKRNNSNKPQGREGGP